MVVKEFSIPEKTMTQEEYKMLRLLLNKAIDQEYEEYELDRLEPALWYAEERIDESS